MQRGPGRRLLDGRQPRPPEGVPRAAAGAVLPGLREALHRLAVPRRAWTSATATLRPGRFLRAELLDRYAGEENGDWKLLVWDAESRVAADAEGQVGHRWARGEGQMEPAARGRVDGSPIDPRSPSSSAATRSSRSASTTSARDVPPRAACRSGDVETGATGRVPVGDRLRPADGAIRRRRAGWRASTRRATTTPRRRTRRRGRSSITGIGRDTVLRFARECGRTAEKTAASRWMIIGAGHQPLVPQQPRCTARRSPR